MGGNITGSDAEFINNLVTNYVQQQGAGYLGELVAAGTLQEGSPEHAALHSVLACAGAAASGQSCSAGAAAAAASSLLTGLFSEASADETGSQREAKRNLIVSLVAGIATATNTDPATAANTATAAVDNNWLASQQRAQANKELSEATTLAERLKIQAKWIGTSAQQDVLTATGLGVGLVQAGWDDVNSISQMLQHPIESLQGMKALIRDPTVREALGDQIFGSLSKKIDRMQVALTEGGADNAIQFGEDLGTLAWHVGSVAVGIGGAAKGAAVIAKIGINLSTEALKGTSKNLLHAPLWCLRCSAYLRTRALLNTISARSRRFFEVPLTLLKRSLSSKHQVLADWVVLYQ